MSEVMATDREPQVTRVPEVMTEEQKLLYAARLKGQVLRKLTIAFIDAKKKFGWTQRDIAKRMGVDESEISHILSGKRKNLSLEKIAIYARAMNRRAEIHLIDPEEAANAALTAGSESSIIDN
jgi:predicted XRE-type DNA-binding protein